MHDIGGIIWVIIVVIGVISSITRNARKAAAVRAAAQTPPPARVAPAVRSQQVSGIVRALHAKIDAGPAGQAAISELPPLPPTAPLEPRPPAPVIAPAAPRAAAMPVRGMFLGKGKALVQAIVAAEVLGPPKSLQEQTIWSPRHSEPSI
jgi:hypothetical protein